MELDISLMHKEDVFSSISVRMTTNTTHPATEPGTLPVPRFRMPTLETALAGVRRGNGRDRLSQRLSLVGQTEEKDMERPTTDFTVESSAPSLVPDPAQILKREHAHPGCLRNASTDHMTHIAAEPHFLARHGAQTPFGGLGAFCLQCASVVAVAPFRGSQTGVPFAVRSDGEIPDAEIDAQPPACDFGRGLHLVVKIEPESVTPVIFQRGGFASPVPDNVPEVVGDAEDHRVGWRLTEPSAVEHDPEALADAGQCQKVAAYGERAEVVPDTEGVFRRCIPFALVALVAPFGRFKRTVSRRLEDGRRNLRVGFPDVVIEPLMGFLFTVCSILGRPLGVNIEYLDAGLKHRKKPVLREVWAQ